MSTVKATYFQHGSASTPNLTLASDGSVSGGLPSPNRNLLYNGAMQVTQRGTSATGITGASIDYFTADRWKCLRINIGTFTQTVENDAPTGSGFRKSLKMLVTTPDSSPAADEGLFIGQSLEGQDLQRIAKGTAAAQPLTLSFWVKSNVTGTYAVEINDSDNSRSISQTYTISASATWEKKVITFPADTTGVLNNDNGESLAINFWLAAGSNYNSGSLKSVWGGSGTPAFGQVNLAAATNNYWQITGVQLEVGPVPTAFEFKSYGQELRDCQRYYWVAPTAGAWGAFFSTTQATMNGPLPVPMRVAPSAAATPATLNVEQPGVATRTGTTFSLGSSTTHYTIDVGGMSGATQWAMARWAGSPIGITAEL